MVIRSMNVFPLPTNGYLCDNPDDKQIIYQKSVNLEKTIPCIDHVEIEKVLPFETW